MHIPLIHQNEDFVVINKPAGVAVHPSEGAKGEREETVADWLVRRYPEMARVGDDPAIRPGIVHRLDKGTSGVMLAARNQRSFEALKGLFKERSIEKTYLALVIGVPQKPHGVIASAIGRLVKNPLKRGTGTRGIRGERHAVTAYRVLERIGDSSLLMVKPKTGRMHQIRVHLASIGHPVAGDRIYGGTRSMRAELTRPFLHAWRLEFSYPAGRRLRFEAPLAPDLQAALTVLRREKKRATIRHTP